MLRHACSCLFVLSTACGAQQSPAGRVTPEPGPAAVAPSAPVTSNSAAAANEAGTAPAASPGKVEFVEDAVPAARQRAKREGKLLFVDAWAEWCHTCLSMKHFVLNDPALARFEQRFVFAAVDTENEDNAAFVGKYAMSVWPTLFIIDPESGDLLGYWPGAASLREVTRFLSDTWDIHEQRRAGSIDENSALGQFLRAKRAQAAQRHADAARSYARAVEKAEPGWSRRDEALLGWIQSLHRSRQAPACVKVGLTYGEQVKGAAIPADFLRYFFSCARGVADAGLKQRARAAAIARLEALVEKPPPDASADDRADAWQILADAREEIGDREGARRAHEARLKLLEDAAGRAPSPAAAATFDYGRAVSYAALGRSEEAVTMLKERVKQLPDSYEPPARLASVLARLGRHAEALVALDQALQHAEGPRRLGYLQRKAELQAKLKDPAGRVKTLEEEVALWEKLAQRQSGRAKGLAEARRRLAAAKQAQNRPTTPP